MTYLSKRKFIIYMVTFSICLALLVPQAFSLSLEQIISRRMSARDYTSEDISGQQLLWVLWAAYGDTNGRRSVPQIGDDYSLIVYPVNETGSYRYIPEINSLVVHNLTVNKGSIPASHYDGQGWVSDASVVLIVVWNQTKMNNGYFASAEAGCLVQNVYLAVASLDLGTCCVGDIDPAGLRSDLNLPSTLFPLLVMPLGYSTYGPYPPASPYDYTTGNLPSVQYSSLSFEDAVRNMVFAQEWVARNLSLQELSQLLWAAYGYTNITAGWHKAYHKTTPDSYAWYPLIIYVANATGVYRYLPDSHPNATPMPMPNHEIRKIMDGDERSDIANAFSGQTWVADAPAIFLIVYNSSYNDGNTGDGGEWPHLFTEVGAGCVVQELFLEASAWDLSANVVGETWDGSGAEELRNILGLPSSAIPLYIVPVGALSGTHYYLTVASNMGGTTSPIPGIYSYIEGSSIKVTAVADPGYSFGYWLLDGEEKTENPVTIVMDANHTLEAFFVDDIPPEIGVPVQEPPENVTPYQNVNVTVEVTDEGTGVREVILSYSTDGGETWANVTMDNTEGNTYVGEIPGFEADTHVQYKIIAYDNADNPAVEDNAGSYYVYTVIPEFPSAIIMPLFMIATLLAVIVYRRKHSMRAHSL